MPGHSSTTLKYFVLYTDIQRNILRISVNIRRNGIGD